MNTFRSFLNLLRSNVKGNRYKTRLPRLVSDAFSTFIQFTKLWLVIVFNNVMFVNNFYWRVNYVDSTLSSALQVRPEIACLWKLAGDCLTMAGSLPRSWHFLEVPEVLCSTTTDNQTLNGLQLFELGAR